MAEPHPSKEPCRICGGPLDRAFESQVLGHVDVVYAVCRECGSLILPEPHWLEEAYSRVFKPDPDYGSLSRTQFIHRCIRRMRAKDIRIVPKGRCLDYGAGKGLLLRMLLDDGEEAWGYDPHPLAIFAEDRVLNRFPEEKVFGLITLIEVIEHTLDPLDVLVRIKGMLDPKGALLVSTEFFNASEHGPDWFYLAPEHGQHVTLFSKEGFGDLVQRAGYRWIGSLPWYGRPFLHMLVPKDRKTKSAFTLWKLHRRHRKHELRFAKDKEA